MLKYKLLPILFFIFFTDLFVNAQPLRHLGNGLDSKVYCACTDSSGDLYAVTSNKTGDSLLVNQWSITGKSWSVYARLKITVNDLYYSSKCVFYNSKFYLLGSFNGNYGNSTLYAYEASTWTNVATISQLSSGEINMVKFDNQLYFAGMLDTINNVAYKRVARFDGNSFSSAGFFYSGTYAMESEISNDTLFMTFGRTIVFHIAPSTWGLYATSDANLTSIAIANKLVYVTDVSRNVMVYKSRNSRMDSIYTGKVNLQLKSFNNKVYLTHRKSDYSLSIRFGELRNKKINYNFHNVLPDSNSSCMVANNNQNLYYFGRAGISVDDVNYHYIAEIKTDSLTDIPIDTIIVRVFTDENKNVVYDSTDAGGIFYMWEEVSGDLYTTNSLGYATLYPMDNEDYTISYNQSYYNIDSCYSQSFTGSLKSKCYNSSVSKETINIPLWRNTKFNKNLILRNYSQNRARLLDTIPLNMYVYTKDCGTNSPTATITVTLDPNTVFVSANPAPVSQSGNVLTFQKTNISDIVSANSLIQLKVVYPNTQYSIGQTVRHYAKLTTPYNEDTTDNLDSFVQRLVYSYDPNVKHSIPEGKITRDLKNVRYYIYFQNEGNADAIRVRVVDTMNLKIPVYEFQMVSASHPYKVSITPGTNIVTWVFDNIHLKPKSENEEASKGYIVFDAKLITNIKIGESIRNNASIYFDYNTPIITNYAVISRVDPKEGIGQLIKMVSSSLKAYPNPGRSFVNIENTLSSEQNLTVYDVKGAHIANLQISGNEVKKINTENWASGLYMIVNEKGEGLKIMIE